MTRGWRVWLAPVFAALLLAGCGDSVEDLLTRADQQRTDGLYQSAIADYREVLAQDPEHPEARFGLGVTQLSVGNDAAAEEALRRAADLGIPADRVQPLLATALLHQNKTDEVLDAIDPDAVEDPALRADLIAARGHAHLRAGRLAEARDLLEEALDVDPAALRALVGTARLERASDRPAEAADYVARALEVDPESSAAWVLRADLAREDGRREDALEAYRRAMELPPADLSNQEHFSARGRLVETLIQANALTEAREQARIMRRQGARHPYANYLSGLVAYGEGDMDMAAERLQAVLSVSPRNPQAKALMGAVQLRQEQYIQAQSLLREVLAGQPEDLRTRLLLVTTLRAREEGEQAVETLAEGIRLHAEDARALTALGNAAGEDLNDVIAALDRAAERDPRARRARLALAQALLGQGETDPALAILRQPGAGSVDEDVSRRQLLALASLNSGDTDLALSEAQRLVADHPDNAEARNLLGGVYLAMERRDDARAAFERARELNPDGPQAHYNLGLLAMSAERPRDAIDHFRQSLERAPENADIRLQLARAQAAAEDFAAAETTLSELVNTHPGRLDARVALARLQLRQGNPRAALETARALARRNGGAAQGRFLEAQAHVALDDREAALETYARAVEAGMREALGPLVSLRAAADMDNPTEPLEQWLLDNPDDNTARVSLATWHLNRGDYDRAAGQYEILADRTDRGNAAILNNLAWVYQQMGDDRALATAREAYALAPDNISIMDTLGWLELEAGNPGLALDLLSEAAANAPDNGQIRYHYGAVLAETGEHDRAADHLRAALELEPDADWAPEARRVLESVE